MAADPVALVRDPNLAKNRIFIGNLPTCTREELESICHPYGNVLGSLVHKNFGFVQFETEEMANKVASALTKSTFKGNIITVRNAGFKPATKRPAPEQTAGQTQNTDCNDCEIIVVNRDNTKYAEYIEERLKRLNLRVDVLFPNEDVSLSKVLANIASRGCLYAVLVTQQHQEHNSITVNILTGNAAEHRNMPVEDAIKLIGEDFRVKMPGNKMPRMSIQNMQKPMHVMPVVNPAVGIALPYAEPLPDFIQNLANLLIRNMPMTVLQHDRLIKFLQERRERQLRAELGEDTGPKTRDPEIELQKKILDILQKPSVAETHHKLYYPNLDAVKEDHELVQLLKDERIRRALDQLIDSPIADYVTKFLKM